MLSQCIACQIARHWNTSDISSSTSMMVHHSTTSPSNVWVCTVVRLAAHTQQQLEQELRAKLVNRCILLWTATACSTACCWCVHSIGLPCFPKTARLPACYSLNWLLVCGHPKKANLSMCTVAINKKLFTNMTAVTLW